MNKLKPCPFCGGEAHIVNRAKRDRENAIVYGVVVYCTSCNAEMFYKREKLAKEAWNRRVPDCDTCEGMKMMIV